MAGDYVDQVAASIIEQLKAGHRALAEAVDTGSNGSCRTTPRPGTNTTA